MLLPAKIISTFFCGTLCLRLPDEHHQSFKKPLKFGFIAEVKLPQLLPIIARKSHVGDYDADLFGSFTSITRGAVGAWRCHVNPVSEKPAKSNACMP
jgi:hypothetical protein